MSHDSKLVYMANQIAKFFESQGHASAVAGTADHIKKFWDPRMRAAIFAHLNTGGAGLDPVARQAIENLAAAAAQQAAH
jgi:formate dehydrogenase subunit delta